jgi:hypothetical protein
VFTPINNHVQLALSKLITQYQNSKNLKALITAFSEQIQIIEDTLGDMNVLRYLPYATGQQLDNIGKIVGLPRPPGLSDAQYTLELYGQIKINTSQGQPEQAIQVFQLFTMVPQVRLFEFFPGDVLIESQYVPPDDTSFNTIMRILGEVLPAGVRPSGLVSYDPTNPFTYAGVMLPARGYGSVSTPGVGGKYGTLRRPFNGPFGYGVNNTSIKGYGTRKDPIVGGAYAG